MNPIIEINNLNFHYPHQEKPALKDVSLTINQGEWVGVIGHNGSGKSTLAKLIDGLLVADSGTIKVAGQVLSEETVWDIRKKIGMVFQNPDNQFVGSDVAGDVAFGLENQGIPRDEMIPRVMAALAHVDMTAFKDHEPHKLSGGQKQRVAIAGVLALAPQIVIFDESTSMLDPKGRREIIALMKKLNKEKGFTVISITHDIDEAALADRIVVLKQGEVLKSGTPSEVFAYQEKLIDLGLELPYAEQLRLALQKAGVAVPDTYLPEERLVEWLCQSALTK